MTWNGNTEYESLSLGITLVMDSHNHAVFWEDKNTPTVQEACDDSKILPIESYSVGISEYYAGRKTSLREEKETLYH